MEAIGDASLDTFKGGHAHRPEILGFVAVLVLAAPDTGSVVLALADAGDVNEHTVAHVDPSGVDDVLAITLGLVDVVRVDIKEIALGDVVVVAVGVIGLELVLGAVHVLAKPLHGIVGNLDVEVIIPGHDLAIPPPTEQGTVGNPRLDALILHDGQVRADEVAQNIAMLGVGYFLVKVTAIVVAALHAATRLVEVLGRLLLVLAGLEDRS